MAHWSFRIEVDRRQVRAVCKCGWRSLPATSAGVAGGLWDLHVEDEAPAAAAAAAAG